MREILFRGKRTDNGEWVVGNLRTSLYPKDHVVASITAQTEKPWVHNIYDVDPATVGQYTGLKDGNGKRIFEGDIVEGPDFCEDDGFGKIIWDEDAARFAIIGSGLTVDFDNYWCYDLLVRGNIHDNPELLKADA